MTQAAIKHAEEFLDESKDFADAPAQKRHTLLRKARAVVMECLIALNPAVRAASSAQASSTPISYDDDLQTLRRPIFEGTTQERNTLQGMIFAIRTAEKMGASNFEIQVTSEKGSGQRSQYVNPLLQMYMGSEDWQDTAQMVHKITIYAVTIK